MAVTVNGLPAVSRDGLLHVCRLARALGGRLVPLADEPTKKGGGGRNTDNEESWADRHDENLRQVHRQRENPGDRSDREHAADQSEANAEPAVQTVPVADVLLRPA